MVVLVASCGGGSSSKSSNARHTTRTTTATATAPTTSTATPTTSTVPTSASPTDALAASLTALGHTYAGDCSTTDAAADAGKWCSLVNDDGADRKVYGTGPVASEIVTIVTVERRGSGWVVTASTPAPQPGT
jgi:hypothetical protein